MGIKSGETKHSEYSLSLAAFVVVMLLLLKSPFSFGFLVIINILTLLSIFWSALSVVRHADVLAHRFGEPFGSLILSLSVVALEVALISILMITGSGDPYLLRDTIVSILMIVLGGFIGFSLLLGGRKFVNQSFNLKGVHQYLIALVPLILILFLLPSSLPSNTLNQSQQFIVAVICVLMYLVFLLLQMGAQQCFFIYEAEDETKDEKPKDSSFTSWWHAIWLLIHLIAVISVVKLNANNMGELFGILNAPAALTGFLIAFLTLLPEGVGATKAVLKNQLQRAMNLYLGAILATISFTVPIVILIAYVTEQSLVFSPDTPVNILILGILFLSSISLSHGQTSSLNGISHLAIFIAYLFVIFTQ